MRGRTGGNGSERVEVNCEFSTKKCEKKSILVVSVLKSPSFSLWKHFFLFVVCFFSPELPPVMKEKL